LALFLRDIEFAPNGNLFGLDGDRSRIHEMDAADNFSILNTFSLGTTVVDFEFSPTGELVAATDFGELAFYDGSTGAVLGSLEAPVSFIADFEFASTVVPSPAALPLFLSAIASLGFVGWRKRKAA